MMGLFLHPAGFPLPILSYFGPLKRIFEPVCLKTLSSKIIIFKKIIFCNESMIYFVLLCEVDTLKYEMQWNPLQFLSTCLISAYCQDLINSSLNRKKHRYCANSVNNCMKNLQACEWKSNNNTEARITKERDLIKPKDL